MDHEYQSERLRGGRAVPRMPRIPECACHGGGFETSGRECLVVESGGWRLPYIGGQVKRWGPGAYPSPFKKRESAGKGTPAIFSFSHVEELPGGRPAEDARWAANWRYGFIIFA